MERFKLSIITINLNNKCGLIDTVESVRTLAKDCAGSFEYIVVDGGSDDGSVEFLEGQRSLINTCIIERDHGIYDAMNKGINVSTGEFIYFLNSGDVLFSKEFLKVLMLLGDSDIYYCDVLILGTFRKTRFICDHKDLWYRMSVSHQGVFIASRIHGERLYDSSFRLSGDFEFLNWCLVSGKQFSKIDAVVAGFMAGGRSEGLFLLSRYESLFALIKSRCYRAAIQASLRYFREAIHLGVIKIVDRCGRACSKRAIGDS